MKPAKWTEFRPEEERKVRYVNILEMLERTGKSIPPEAWTWGGAPIERPATRNLSPIQGEEHDD